MAGIQPARLAEYKRGYPHRPASTTLSSVFSPDCGALTSTAKAHVIGLSILSGSHLPLVKDVISQLKEAGIDNVPGGGGRHHSAGGTLRKLEQAGVAAVYTAKDFDLNRIMSNLVRIVESRLRGG